MSVSAAYARCEQIARRSASQFYPTFWILPRVQRRSMYALYAFNRLTDDVVDGPGRLPDKQQALNYWQQTLNEALAGRPHPVLSALHDTVLRFDIPPTHLHAVIEGCRMDLEPRPFRCFDELYRYCTLVASSVGIACIHIWGFRDPAALPPAESAGVALQLTNILRDLGEDRARGRVYLPLDDLQRFGCDPQTICTDANCPSFQALMRFQVERTKRYYHSAEELDQYLAPAGRAINRMIIQTYRQLLTRIESARFDVFSTRIRVPRSEKMKLLMQAVPLRLGWARG
jgi:phytoene synthase